MIAFCRRHPVLLLFASSVFSALPMTFPFLFLLSWISFIPLFFVFLDGEKPRFWKSFFRSFFFGFCYHTAVYFWFLWLYPFDSVGFSKPVAAFVALLGWLGASLIHGFLFSLIGVVRSLFGRFSVNRLFTGFGMIFTFIGIEKLMELSALAFPWVRVSLGQYRAPLFIQSASLWGILGVDLLILSVNLLLTLALLSRDRKRILAASLAGGVFLVNLLAGSGALIFTGKDEKTVRIGIVQGCILSGEKWAEGGFSYALKTHFELTRKAAEESPDLIVWAETALPVRLDSPNQGSLREEMMSLSAEAGCPLLVGAYSTREGKLTNSAYLITPDSLSEPYSKRRLVPFGEMVPYRDFFTALFPMLDEINQIDSDLAPGVSSALFSQEGNKLGALICYESIFPDLCRKSVKDGAEMLAVITNDSWYEDSPAAAQHLAHAVFRSVENRRALLRCANSGISAFILPDGRVTAELGTLEKGVLSGELSFSDTSTLYTLLGDWILLVFAGTDLVLTVVFTAKERRRDGRKN